MSLTAYVREKRKRTGFTLIEVMIASACGVMMILAVVLLLRGGIRLFRAEEGRTSSLQDILLAYDRIQKDIRQALFYPALEHAYTVRPEAGGKVLTLALLDKSLPPDPPVRKPEITTRMVVFSLQAIPGRDRLFYLSRTEDGVSMVFKSVMLRDIMFRKETRILPGEGATSILKMFITAYSTHDDFDEVVFPFIFVLEPETGFMRNKYWQSGF